MKRNIELIRDICLALEGAPETNFSASLREKGYSEEEIGFHIYLLGDAGYARVVDITSMDDAFPKAIPRNLTWLGYEFLESAREDNRWAKAKDVLRKVGSFSLEVMFEFLKKSAKQELGL